MLRLAADADVKGGIVHGLRLRRPDIDLVRAQDALPQGTPDPQVLDWAAADNRVLITNDRDTMTGHAIQRVLDGLPMPGIIVTADWQSIGSAIDDILLIAVCLSPEEMRDRSSVYLPFKG